MINIVKGDKIRLVKPMGVFTNVGEVCDVIDVNESGVISFRFGNGMHMGCMSYDEFTKYFEKYEEPKNNTVTSEMIEEIMNHSKVIVSTVFDKCTVVSCKLPNGFVIVEYSACVDPKNYDEDMGVEICMKKIVDKVWELEGYRLQQMIYENTFDNAHPCGCDEDCDTCNDEVFSERCPFHCNDDCESCEKQ